MPTQQCLNNIKAEPPPSNIPCTNNLCAQMQASLDKHCQSAGLSPDTPVISFDPSLGKTCYCCCSCYTLNTPIAATPAEFVLIQDINAGDTVQTAGVDLQWHDGTVKERSGDIELSMVPFLYLVKYRIDSESQDRELLVTADHLFLMHSSKTLKKVQHLIPGNKLTAADGNPAPVTFVATGEYNTALQSITMVGKFDGGDLDGHLLNANGVVSTDYAVQAYYETHSTEAHAKLFQFDNSDDAVDVGSEPYIEKFETQALADFLDDPGQWPVGFAPKRRRMVNVPATAAKFLTSDEEQEIRENAEFNPLSTGSSRDTFIKLFRMYEAYHPDVTFILDWQNRHCNAYSWTTERQKFVVIAGGLARIKNLYSDGYAVIIADILARLGDKCVAEADYNSTMLMRDIWPNATFGDMAVNGITQIDKALFAFVKNNGGDPEDVCLSPSLSCRTETLWAGFGFMPQPKCGIPAPADLVLQRAYFSADLSEVTVSYNLPVDPATGTTTDNYALSPDIGVTGARIPSENPAVVVLSVEGAQAGGKYVFEVSNVTSIDNAPLVPALSYSVIIAP